MTGLRADGAEMAEAITVALDEARLNPSDIDYVNAHGSGTKQNDRHETAAFKRSLGEHARRTPISSIKSMIGHSLGAIGSLEVAASLLAMRHDVVHRPRISTRPTRSAIWTTCRSRARVADRHGAQRGQRLRRLPERHGLRSVA